IVADRHLLLLADARRAVLANVDRFVLADALRSVLGDRDAFVHLDVPRAVTADRDAFVLLHGLGTIPADRDRLVVADVVGAIVFDRRGHVVLAVNRDQLGALGVVERNLVVAAAAFGGVGLHAADHLSGRQGIRRHLLAVVDAPDDQRLIGIAF